jgi:hypothetical protein
VAALLHLILQQRQPARSRHEIACNADSKIINIGRSSHTEKKHTKKKETQIERKQGHLETVSHTQEEEEINKNANRNVSKKFAREHKPRLPARQPQPTAVVELIDISQKSKTFVPQILTDNNKSAKYSYA